MRVESPGSGVVLPELRLAFDLHVPGHDIVVSHAHGDHVPWGAPHAYASKETADLLAIRSPELDVTVLPWGEPTRIGESLVTLHPAGHILGSALVHVETRSGETLLYTGDTKPTECRSCEPPRYVEADTLIVESTFGLPIFRFPGRARLEETAVAFARETLAEGKTPVFLGYNLGKAQELIALLGHNGVPVSAHGAAWNLCAVYERHGIDFPHARAYVRGETAGSALVVPPSFRSHGMVTALDARVCYASGWALLSRSRAQRDADLLLPLSDHADYDGLFDIVSQVKPRRILTNHGYADVFAHLLRKAGHDAQPLAVGHLEEDEPPTRAQTRLEA